MSGEVGKGRPRRPLVHARRSRLRRRRSLRGTAITAARNPLATQAGYGWRLPPDANVTSQEASHEVDARPSLSAAQERSSGLVLTQNPRVFSEAPERFPRRGGVDGLSNRSIYCPERVLVDTVSFPAKPLDKIMAGFSQSADGMDHHLRPRFAEPYRGDEAVFSHFA
jgi:hypothetical protein